MNFVSFVHCIEREKTDAVTSDHVAEQISQVEAAIKWYRIKDPKLIVNVDEFGISSKNFDGWCARKGTGPKSKELVFSLVKTTGNLDHVTNMSVVTSQICQWSVQPVGHFSQWLYFLESKYTTEL